MMLPNLEELKHKDCVANDVVWRLSDKDKFKSCCMETSRNLQEIPADFGEICTLESIELHDCSTTAEDSARNIAQEQEDMGNNFLKGIKLILRDHQMPTSKWRAFSLYFEKPTYDFVFCI